MHTPKDFSTRGRKAGGWGGGARSNAGNLAGGRVSGVDLELRVPLCSVLEGKQWPVGLDGPRAWVGAPQDYYSGFRPFQHVMGDEPVSIFVQ